MKTIGILIGTKTAEISDEYYSKNKKKLEYLDTLPKKIQFKSEGIPYDYAILCEFKHLETKYKVDVIPLYGPLLSLENANKCDFIFCIYEGVFSFINGGYEGYHNYINVLSKTKAKVYPSVKLQKFIINKQKYIHWLQTNGFDIIPTKFITINSYIKDKQKVINTIRSFNQNNGYDYILMKPELGAFAGSLKILKRISDKSICSYFDKMKVKGYKKILVQPYIPEFSKFYEIKTMWLNGKYFYSYGIIVGGETDDNYPESEGGTIPEEYITKCKQTCKKILPLLFKEFGKLVLVRIDFGCCINNDNLCRDYFVNEIEIMPTLLDSETTKDNFKLIAESVLKIV